YNVRCRRVDARRKYSQSRCESFGDRHVFFDFTRNGLRDAAQGFDVSVGERRAIFALAQRDLSKERTGRRHLHGHLDLGVVSPFADGFQKHELVLVLEECRAASDIVCLRGFVKKTAQHLRWINRRDARLNLRAKSVEVFGGVGRFFETLIYQPLQKIFDGRERGGNQKGGHNRRQIRTFAGERVKEGAGNKYERFEQPGENRGQRQIDH